MCHRFFNGVVSEQAEKSARAAWINSKKGRDNLWTLVSGRMLQGKHCLLPSNSTRGVRFIVYTNKIPNRLSTSTGP